MKKVVEQLQFKKNISCHSLRHSYATQLLGAGVDLPERHESYNGRPAARFPTARTKTRLNSLVALTLFFQIVLPLMLSSFY